MVGSGFLRIFLRTFDFLEILTIHLRKIRLSIVCKLVTDVSDKKIFCMPRHASDDTKIHDDADNKSNFKFS